MKHKIVLLFLVTSLSMATAPVLAANNNSAIPSKPSVNLFNNNPQNKEEKPEEAESWFSKRNVGVGLVVTAAVYLDDQKTPAFRPGMNGHP